MINLPEAALLYNHIILVPVEEGEVGFAALHCYSICLWSRDTNTRGLNAGDAGWAKHMVIDLEKLLPARNPMKNPLYLIGVADDANIILVNTYDDAVFTVELMSLRASKVCERNEDIHPFPYMCVYTPHSASLPSP